MNERCNDCAFTKGTEANKFELTAIKVSLCLDLDEPFQCHVRPGLCAGFEEAYKHHRPQTGWKKDLSAALMDVLADAEEGKFKLTEDGIQQRLRDMIKGLDEEKGNGL